MKPQTQQYVKCLLRNGPLVEGIVQDWNDKEVRLLSLDGESLLIIPHPNDDIILIKIMLDGVAKPIPAEKPKPKLQSELEAKFDQTRAQSSDTPGRTETLAELKIELAEAERAVIADKLKDHHVGGPGFIKYGNPFLGGKKKI